MGLFALIKLLLICAFLLLTLNLWLQAKQSVFEPAKLAAIGRKYSQKGLSERDRVDRLIRELRAEYGASILPESRLRWLLSYAGGAYGQILILHASFTEYLLIFGVNFGHVAFSGRHLVNISDTILTGKVDSWLEGELSFKSYFPGDTCVHQVGSSGFSRFDDGTWTLEYGRGIVPTIMLFGLADTLLSGCDLITAVRTIYAYSSAIFYEYGHSITDLLLT